MKPDGRHLSELITDKAISYIDTQKKAAPDKPFFLYYAPGATHAPHQVAAEWSDRYKGTFDDGWDAYRERVFAEQKRLGIIPANAVLPDRDPNVEAWASLSFEERKLYARFMEVYAGYLTYTDYEIGRLIDHLKETNQFDNTLFVVMIGDNGGCRGGTIYGDIDRDTSWASKDKPLSEKENVAYNLSKMNLIGTPEAVQGNYPVGWAQATNTPFRLWKSDANSEGGTRNPLIISWPNGIRERGIRTQYGHVIDILPTTLDLLGIKPPEEIRHVPQKPIEGVSLAYSISDAQAASRHRLQYYYIFGSLAIYQDGWKASQDYPNSFYLLPKDRKPDENVWELYNLNEDPTERVDLSKRYPEKLAELRALFNKEAKDHNLYPLITWGDVRDGKTHRPAGAN
ncbi:sulfatase-like protein [Bradyrhizobium macuxiense]|uniref:Sulfatase-like protein n=1 Tax=Bradyrhizobium macuxiense TaxID=1755647 RepID=A0A560KUM3_9BRAD|nr:sulfatase-like protein [Bradyrhizobium macuxiense]